MKLLGLKINGYKNLKDADKVIFDFSNCTNYTALIGLNGSGKSNILEAISLIFSSLYHDTKLDFDYFLAYEIDGVMVQVINSVMTVTEPIGEGEIAVAKSAHNKYLPTNVIASYSGEELRMWESIYLDSYSDFFQDIKKQTSFVPKLLYINKFSWEFALIALLSSDDPIIKSFIRNILKIGEDTEVQFTIEEGNYGLYTDNDSLSLIKRLIELQKESVTNTIPIQTIATLDLNQKDNKDFTQKLFYYLFITGMPVKGDKIKADKIIRKTKIIFDGIDVKMLSEGEKKLILIYTITHLLADNKTLILLDEPDSHIHIERKKDIIDIIDKEDCFTLFTTHSPKILNCINENNIRLVKNSDDIGVEILNLDKINALSEITNGEFSIIDATLALSTSKDILLVEGEYDLIYINEAINRLNKIKNNKYANFNFLIINCGGAGNVPAIFREIVAPNLKSNQFCLATFDSDKAGKDGISSIQKYLIENPMPNVQTMTHLLPPNWDADKEFFMEDYYPVNSYKQILLDDINSKTKIKDFEQLSKYTVKSIINKNHKTFSDDDFLNFEPLLDDFINKQTAFHNS